MDHKKLLLTFRNVFPFGWLFKIGLVSFSTTAKLYARLDDYSTTQQLNDVVANMTYENRRTNISGKHVSFKLSTATMMHLHCVLYSYVSVS